jgi:hypothetical protein
MIIIPRPPRPGDPPPPPFRTVVRYAVLAGLVGLAVVATAMFLGGAPLF